MITRFVRYLSTVATEFVNFVLFDVLRRQQPIIVARVRPEYTLSAEAQTPLYPVIQLEAMVRADLGLPPSE